MVDFRLLYMFDYQRVGLRTHRVFTRHPRLRFGNKPAKIHQIILLCQICSYLRFGAIGSITYPYTCFVIIPNIPNKDTATKSNHHGLAMPVGPALEATRPSRDVFSSNSHGASPTSGVFLN